MRGVMMGVMMWRRVLRVRVAGLPAQPLVERLPAPSALRASWEGVSMVVV